MSTYANGHETENFLLSQPATYALKFAFFLNWQTGVGPNFYPYSEKFACHIVIFTCFLFKNIIFTILDSKINKIFDFYMHLRFHGGNWA